MQSHAQSPEAYLAELPEDRRAVVEALITVFRSRLPAGFEETLQYGMLAYVVPLSLYSPGYHRPPKQPLPFIAIASQKQYIALYHMALYAMPDLKAWFIDAYGREAHGKPDMGKSCIRFKKLDQVPYGLLGDLAEKITPEQWISVYEAIRKG